MSSHVAERGGTGREFVRRRSLPLELDIAVSGADSLFPSDFFSSAEPSEGRPLDRLEEKLVDAEWLHRWCDHLRILQAGKSPAERVRPLPGEALPPDRGIASSEETPQHLQSLIEQIAAARDGLAPLLAERRVSPALMRELLLHPAAVCDLHLALCTSSSLYWVTRVEAAIRRNAERRREDTRRQADAKVRRPRDPSSND